MKLESFTVSNTCSTITVTKRDSIVCVELLSFLDGQRAVERYDYNIIDVGTMAKAVCDLANVQANRAIVSQIGLLLTILILGD